MPTVVGLSRAAAESAVQEANLTLGKVSEKYSETVRDGLVITASEKAGSPAEAGHRRSTWSSPGVRRRSRSRATSGSRRAAEAALRKAGFTVVTNTEHSDKIAKGLVIRQDPTSGTGRRGDTITLTRSLGPVLVTVPNVRSMGVRPPRR